MSDPGRHIVQHDVMLFPRTSYLPYIIERRVPGYAVLIYYSSIMLTKTRRRSWLRPLSSTLLIAVQCSAFAPTDHVTKTNLYHPSTTSLHVFDFFKKAQESTAESLAAITTGLAKSRNAFLYNLEDALAGESGNLMDNLEDTLLQADLGMATTDDVLEEARTLREGTKIFGREDVKALLRGKLLEALGASDSDEDNKFALRFATEKDGLPIRDRARKTPLTIHFIMGANGMGKTTTIGKLAHRLKTETGQKILLAACDTFRAGAVAQLEQWGERAEVDCFSPTETTNGPSAVLYGALDKAIKEDYDVLLVDTSGRLSNNDALTRELEKMKRVIQKRMSVEFDETIKPVPNLDTPHETLLVIDAAQGRMALDSAKQWDQEVGLTGLILTKLDGSAKGGSVVAVSRELDLPVKLIGVGEGIEDLRDVSSLYSHESFICSMSVLKKMFGQI